MQARASRLHFHQLRRPARPRPGRGRDVGDAEAGDQHVPHALCHRAARVLDSSVEDDADSRSWLDGERRRVGAAAVLVPEGSAAALKRARVQQDVQRERVLILVWLEESAR